MVQGDSTHRRRKGRAVDAGRAVVGDNVAGPHKLQRTTSLVEGHVVVDHASAELQTETSGQKKNFF